MSEPSDSAPTSESPDAGEHLRLTTSGPVATLVIDRPAKRNAMSLRMWSAVPVLVARVAADPELKVLVLRGDETAFSVGADIGEFRTERAEPAGAGAYGAAVRAAEQALVELPKATIAAVRGYCIGGGCELALACDLRIASDDATFGITPAKLGIVYGLHGTKRLVDTVGPAWARQILFTADFLDAATALRIGLVNEVHPVASFDARVNELAERIASRAQVSVRGSKAIIDRILDGQFDDDEQVRELYRGSHVSSEYAEGVTAFLEKRTPTF